MTKDELIKAVKEKDEILYVYQNTSFEHWHGRALKAEEQIAALKTENERLQSKLPEDVRSFIYTVTLFLQASREKKPEQMDAMFQRAYKLYVKYDVEGRDTLKEATNDILRNQEPLGDDFQKVLNEVPYEST